MAGRSCSFTPSPQPFNLPPLSLPVTLSGLLGRPHALPIPPHLPHSQSPGHARAYGLREVGPSPAPPQMHPRAFQFSRDSLCKPFRHPLIASVRSHQPSPAPRNKAWAPPTRLRPFQPRHQPPLPVPRPPTLPRCSQRGLTSPHSTARSHSTLKARLHHLQLQEVSGSYRILTPLPHPPSSRLLLVPPTSGFNQSEASNWHAWVGAGGWVRACVYAMGGAIERAPDWLGRRARAVTSCPWLLLTDCIRGEKSAS